MLTSESVTIICICFNQEEWVEECLESVRLQDYSWKELIVIDNGSKDKSLDVIRNWINEKSGTLSVQLISHDEPLPYPVAFNAALGQVKSQYVVDLAGDDVFYPDHLSMSIDCLKQSPEAAFVFSDAYILEESGLIQTFYKRGNGGELRKQIEIERIYETLVQYHYICSPTIVFNRPILVKEGGYDENLSYEDFDIQVRLAREYPVVFSDHVGVLKRKHSESLSSRQYTPYHSVMLPSTLLVCQKIKEMNESESENKALEKRLLYELKHALWSGNFEVAKGFIELGKELGIKSLMFGIYKIWSKTKLDLAWLYVRIT